MVEIAATEEKGGCKFASATISGQGVYGRLKFESGIHRVQRVPATEASGRLHTSAASVAILPQADEVTALIPDHTLPMGLSSCSARYVQREFCIPSIACLCKCAEYDLGFLWFLLSLFFCLFC